MSDPRLLGTLERVAHALEAQTKLQRQALVRLGWLIEEPEENDSERSAQRPPLCLNPPASGRQAGQVPSTHSCTRHPVSI